MAEEITITIRKGDLEAITTAFWVCSEIATGGMVAPCTPPACERLPPS